MIKIYIFSLLTDNFKKVTSIKIVLLILFFSFLSIGYTFAASQACTSGGDQVTYGSGSWRGYVYDGTFTTYKGYVTETENFDRNWGSTGTDQPACVAGTNSSFTMRYLMVKSYPAGTYTITHGQDDGTRVFIGTSAITTVAGFSSISWSSSRWASSGLTTYTFDWAGGPMNIVFEFNETGGGAQANFKICYNGPIQDYGTSSWNGYYYKTTDYNTTNYAGQLATSYYTTNTLGDINRANSSSAPALISAPSGTTACSGSAATYFATRYLLENNFTRSFYLFTINSDDGVRVSTQGPGTWTTNSSPSSWNIFDNWKTNGTYSNQNITAVLDGNTNMVIEHGQGGGAYLVRNQICKMNGDYTLPTFPTWNAYAFNSSNVDFKTYASWYKTTSSGTTLIDNNFGAATPANSGTGTTITGYTAGGCIGAPTLTASNFSTRYITRRNYLSNGVWVFSSTLNDDGRRLYIDYGSIDSPQLIFDQLSSGAAAFATNPISIDAGSNDLYYDFRAGAGNNRANLVECQMDGGDLTAYRNSGTWNIYYYDAKNYNFTTATYRGITTSLGSANTTSAILNNVWTGSPSPSGACGTSCGGDFSIRGLVSQVFEKGIYEFATGGDDNSRIRINELGWFNTTTGNSNTTSNQAMNGSTDIEYQMWDNGGDAGARVNITCVSAVEGVLSSNQACSGTGNTILSWSGGLGYNQLEQSTDGSSWANVTIGTTGPWTELARLTTGATARTWTLNPTNTTYYRVRSASCPGTVYSNVIAITRSATYVGNVTIANDITLSGTITINGDFTLNSGKTITVQQGCPLVINATNITINGTIDGEGSGNLGSVSVGAGGQNSLKGTRNCGGGSKGNSGVGSGGGAAGNNGGTGARQGRGGACATGCCPSSNCKSGAGPNGYNDGGGGGGGGGGGAYGGSGGNGGNGAKGGWFSAPDWSCNTAACAGNDGGNGGNGGSIFGTPSGLDISMGSGGGSSGGGGGGNTAGSNGASGGNGGGSVSLIACNAITIAGTINMNGALGNNGGGSGGDENDASNNLTPDGYEWWECGIVNKDNCWGNRDLAGGQGGGSGGGSGGGVLIQGFGPVNITGTVTANGGVGGVGTGFPNSTNANYTSSPKLWGSNSGYTNITLSLYGYYNAQNGAGGGGGRIKVFSNPCQVNNISIPSSAVNAGIGGSGNGNTAGNNGNNGTIDASIMHPLAIDLESGSISTANQTICYNTTPVAIDAETSTGGAYDVSSACKATLPAYLYTWYVTKSLATCATSQATNSTANAPSAGWVTFTGNSSEDLTVTNVQAGITATGGSLTTPDIYCFQRKTNSANCNAWTDKVSITILNDVSNAVATANLASCADPSMPYAELNAILPIQGTGTWSIVSGSGTLASTTLNSTTITALSTSGVRTEVKWQVAYVTAPTCPKSQTLNIDPPNLTSNITQVSLQNDGAANSTGIPAQLYRACRTCSVKDGKTYTFYDANGKIIAKIEDKNSDPADLGNTEVCIGYDYNPSITPNSSNVKTIIDNRGYTQPYLPRSWTIKPNAGSDATVTLYFSKAEYDALQARAVSTAYIFSGLDLAVTKYPGGTGAGQFIAPASPSGVFVPSTFGSYNNDYKVTFDVSSFSTFYIHPQTFPFAALPVELVSFTGYNFGSKNILNWETASERNTDKFEIQKLRSDGNEWINIGFQKASGNSTQQLNYTLTDNTPLIGSNYYRLKIIDNDGSFAYSNNINILVAEALVNSFVKIYPNPTEGNVNIEIQSVNSVNSELKITNLIGQIVSISNIQLLKGLTIIPFDMSDLSNGVYMVSFVDAEGKNHVEKLIKK